MNSTIEVNRTIPIPLYYQLKENLKKTLQKDFSPGEKFYSERQLADLLSVSRLTANRVLTELVQEQVLYRLQGKGTFVANAKERAKTFNVGFMISRRLEDLGDGGSFQRLIYIKDVCSRFGYSVFFLSENAGGSGRENLAKLIDKIDGIIIMGDVNPDLIKFFDEKVPTVIMDDCPLSGKFDCVMGDNIAGSYESVSYLIKNGHRRIATIYGPLCAASFRERLDGYKKALADNGIKYSDELVVEGGGLIENGYDAMGQLLALKNPPTAVFGSNDIMAIGAMKKIKDSGLKVPDDISVIGFDDTATAATADPPLTTMRFDKKILAEKTLERLVAKIDNGPREAAIERTAVELIIRKSCRKI